jgi:hypothetical protein
MYEKIWCAFGLSVVGILILTALWANSAGGRPLERKYVLLELHPDGKKLSENSPYMRTER